MSLQEQVGLDVWVVELGVVQLVGDLLSQLERRKIAGDEQVTQPEISTWAKPHLSQARNPSKLEGRGGRIWVKGVQVLQ